MTVDSFVHRLGVMPDVIKIDVEGAENLVLRGAQDTFKQSKTENLSLNPFRFASVDVSGLSERTRLYLRDPESR